MVKAAWSVMLLAGLLTGCGSGGDPNTALLGSGILVSSDQTGNWEVFIFNPESSITHQVTREAGYRTDLDAEVLGADFLQEKRIQGSSMGSNRFRVDMPRYVEFYLQGRLHLDQLISQRIKLDQINEVFEVLETGDIAHSVITFD